MQGKNKTWGIYHNNCQYWRVILARKNN